MNKTVTQTQLTFFSDTEQYATALADHPDFRVLRRLVPREVFRQPDGRALSKGIVIDTETTGLIAGQDKIIELAMLSFEFDAASGEVFRILDSYTGFEDPGEPIPPESIAVHGITDEMVAGQQIDDTAVAAFIDGAALIIAHNARFDRQFLEVRLPLFEQHAWACSFAQVDWQAGGIASAKLEFIAYRM
ncbi:MAG: 3'-5' exonuclease [Janthinobacterium lividum]